MRRIYLILSAAALLVGAAACSGGKKAEALADSAASKTAAAVETVGDKAAEAADKLTGETGKVIVVENGTPAMFEQWSKERAVVDFGATWCGPCEKFHPVLEAAAKAYPDIKFYYVDVDKNEDLFASTGKDAIPYVVIFDGKGGKKEYTGIEKLVPLSTFEEQLKGL